MKVRTSVMRSFAVVAASALAFAACDDKSTAPVVTDPVTVTVAPQTLTLTVGGTGSASASVQNANTNPALNWRSANPAVATVSPATGNTVTITAVSPGNTVITAISAQDTTARASVAVTVNAVPPSNVNITLTPPAATIGIGGTVNLVPVVTGSANTAFTCRSAATGVATVTAACVVTGVAPGTAVITALAAADTTKKATATITVSTNPPPVVTVTPATASAAPSATVQFVATVAGAANQNVTWRSSVGFVTVSPTGLATVAATATPGQVAVITAVSAADTTARASATLTVISPPAQPSISIESVVNQATGLPISVNQVVAGNMVVTVNVTAGAQTNISSVQVRLGGTTACEQTFAPPLAPTQGVAQIICVVNTAQLDSITNQPIFPNATYELTAVALDPQGAVAATATFGNVVLINTNVIIGTVTFVNTLDDTDNDPANESAVDGTGLTWFGGDAIVNLTTAVFQGSPITALSVTLDLNCNGVVDGGEATRAVTVGANATGTVTFSEANNQGAATPGIDDLQDPSVCFLVSNFRDVAGAVVVVPTTGGAINVIAAGAPAAVINPLVGPGQNQFAIDNVQPAFPGALALPATVLANLNWAGLNTPFTTTSVTNSLAVDGGVGGVTVRFIAVLATALPAAPTQAQYAAAAAAGTAITNSNQLPASTIFNNEYTLVVEAKDALGNVVYGEAGDFGVDLTMPTAVANAATTTVDASINPALLQIDARVSDTFSGPSFVRSRIFLYNVLEVDANADTDVQCIDGAGNVTTVPASGVCATFDVGLIDLPGTTEQAIVPIAPLAGVADEGYVQVFSWSVDRAGNASADTIKRLILIDNTAPGGMINQFTVVLATGSVSLDGTIMENVDINNYDVRYNFPGIANISDQIPFTTPVNVDSFGLPLTGVHNVTGQNTVLIREIFDGVATIVPNQLGFGVWDVARNFGFIFQALGFTAGNGTGLVQSEAFGLNSFDLDVSAAGANTITLDRSSGPTSTPLTAIVTTGPTAANPIADVFFYFVHPGADLTDGTADDFNVLIGSVPASAAAVQTGVTERTFIFTTTVTGTVGSPFPIDSFTYRVFAIARAPDGDAIMSDLPTVRIQP